MATTLSTPVDPPRPTWPGQAGDAGRLSRSIELSDEARAVLVPAQNVGEFVALLRRRGLAIDAIRVLAHWLTRREGVWWACRCVRETLPRPDLESQAAALEAAEHWAAEPTDARRRAAGAAAEAANYETPAALAALACFWSEGSMAPAETGPVPAPPHLAPGAVANAIQLNAVFREPEKAGARLERYLDLGIAVARGEDRPKPAPSPTA